MVMSNSMKDFLPQMMRKAILIFLITNVLIIIFQAIFPLGVFPPVLNGGFGMFYYAGMTKSILLDMLHGLILYSIALALYRFKLILALIYILVVNINYLFESLPYVGSTFSWLFNPHLSVSFFMKSLIFYFVIQTLVVMACIFMMLKSYLTKSKKPEQKIN